MRTNGKEGSGTKLVFPVYAVKYSQKYSTDSIHIGKSAESTHKVHVDSSDGQAYLLMVQLQVKRAFALLCQSWRWRYSCMSQVDS